MTSFSRFLKSKVVLLQTELEAGKILSDTLEKENAKHLKKIKKLNAQVDKSSDIKNSLENALTALKEKQEIMGQNLKVKKSLTFYCNELTFIYRKKTQLYLNLVMNL